MYTSIRFFMHEFLTLESHFLLLIILSIGQKKAGIFLLNNSYLILFIISSKIYISIIQNDEMYLCEISMNN